MSDLPESSPVALITGAARGLGARSAQKLAAGGWRVFLVDICSDDPAVSYRLATMDDLEQTLAACRSVAGREDRAAAMVGDVRRPGDLVTAVAAAVERFDGLDAAIAVAGAIEGGSAAWETTDDVWRTMLDINLTGVWSLARAAIPALLTRSEPRRGRFVAVSSAAGLRGFPQLAAYSAAKHGVIGLVRSMAVELGESGVTANVVCPGSMDTAMLAASAAIYHLSDPSEFAQHHTSKRLLDCDEVANLIVWLCSAESSAVTGAVLAADAGMTAR